MNSKNESVICKMLLKHIETSKCGHEAAAWSKALVNIQVALTVRMDRERALLHNRKEAAGSKSDKTHRRSLKSRHLNQASKS